MYQFVEILKVIFLGIVEGITEWLPISSTGHMILVDEFLKLDVSDNFREMFFVVIQLGAIAAVPILFWKKLFPFSRKKTPEERNMTWSLWLKICVGVIPAGILGVLLDDILEEHLYNFIVVAVALVVYGVGFILVEHFKKDKEYRVNDVYDISYKDAVIIGCYQTLSLIPGTSRSGSTILGGMLSGVSRTAASEFSFFMAIPVMLGASMLKVVKMVLLDHYFPSVFELVLLIIGMEISLAISLVVIEFLMSFVKKHSFKSFGIYRIALGGVLILYYIMKAFL